MKTFNRDVSACRHCQNYQGEGRRGGQCQQLGVPVNGAWKACSLAIPPFASDWQELEEVVSREAKVCSRDEILTSVERISVQASFKMPIHHSCLAREQHSPEPEQLTQVLPLSA